MYPVIPARLLLVEDDPDLRSMLTELLTANGYTVEAAADGQTRPAPGPDPDVRRAAALRRKLGRTIIATSAAAGTNWDDREPPGRTVNHRGRP